MVPSKTGSTGLVELVGAILQAPFGPEVPRSVMNPGHLPHKSAEKRHGICDRVCSAPIPVFSHGRQPETEYT